jgi:hypothetical protein
LAATGEAPHGHGRGEVIGEYLVPAGQVSGGHRLAGWFTGSCDTGVEVGEGVVGKGNVLAACGQSALPRRGCVMAALAVHAGMAAVTAVALVTATMTGAALTLAMTL